MAKFTTIRCMLAIRATMELEIHQMDVKITFLNGELEEDIYMDQPQGFVQDGKEHLMCKLKNSLYGLRPSPIAWYQRMAVKRIMRYLKGTLDLKLYFEGKDVTLRGYCDANWGGDANDRRSTTGVRVLCWSGSSLMELQEATYNCLVYHRGQIHGH